MDAQNDKELFNTARWHALATELGMSRRQREIARRILRGLGDKQIAAELEIAVPTIRTHLGRMFRKYGVQDRVELVLLLVRRGLGTCRDCPQWQSPQQ